MKNNPEYFMLQALKEAEKALQHNDVPIGAVIVKDDKIIAKGHNQVEKNNDSTAHAELIVIKKAIKKIGYKHLLDCDLYVTLEPCSMCIGAIILARLRNLFFATDDMKSGACGSILNIPNEKRLNHKVNYFSGILQEESSMMLKDFFKKLRNNKTVDL